MKETIKTVRFTCDGWYFNHWRIEPGDGKARPARVLAGRDTIECRNRGDTPNEASITISGTKEEIEDAYRRAGWSSGSYRDEHLCPRKHYE